MATYRLSSKGQQPFYGADFRNYGRTDAYRFTVSSKNDPELLALKRSVQDHNKMTRDYVRKNPYNLSVDQLDGHINRLQRVSLMARGARRDAQGRHLHRNCDSNLNHKYGVEFDVYVHNDSHAAWKLKREIETGLRPSEQNKIAQLQNEIWKLEFEALNRIR